jgi:hypothetical protein
MLLSLGAKDLIKLGLLMNLSVTATFSYFEGFRHTSCERLHEGKSRLGDSEIGLELDT